MVATRRNKRRSIKTKKMRSRIVIWGRNEKEERLLLAIELKAQENKVNIHTFPESDTTELFYNLMMNEWRQGHAVEFPANHQTIETPLSASESFLPENLKVERSDVISRAQAEWHFIVLSAKMHEMFKNELGEIKDRIESLGEFQQGIWEELKEFWSKVQGQVREKNLFREHGNELRDETNKLFDALKKLRAAVDEKFKAQSSEIATKFMEGLEEINERIGKGLGLKPIFEDLKKMQSDFRDSKLTRRDRDKVWKKLDAAFKAVKEKRFGGSSGQAGGKADRLQRRLDGLVKALARMEKSIDRDKKDIQFQENKIATTDGQLEAQIRAAKLKMIEERIRSKEEKLTEMREIEKSLEAQLKKERERQERQSKMTEAKEDAKEKIAQQIETQQESLDDEKLKKAAEQIKEGQSQQQGDSQTMIEAIGNTLGESMEDVVDTIKAVAEVVSDKISDTIDELKDELTKEEE